MATDAVPRVSPPASSWRTVPWAVAAGTFVLLVATASGYVWHRDELYFVAASAGASRTTSREPPPSTYSACASSGVSAGWSGYAQAGVSPIAALELLGPDRGLVLPVFSGHNALADAGPPPADAAPVVLVGGWSERTRAELFGDCDEAARIDNGVGLNNEEQGAGVYVCAGPEGGWAETWPSIRHLD